MRLRDSDSYEKALSILTSQGKFHISLGLERILRILELLGNPQIGLKVIHVAGTNGKGSTCAMLASVLTEAGWKTGLYTSPHLVDYTERVKISGQDISREDFSRLIFQIVNLIDENNIPATEFEILTALAFIYFEEQKVDYVVLETGLGGRLDATNVLESPLVSVITSIDIDHADRLGNEINQIAYEKAGIIKKDVPAITLADNNGLEVIKKIAAEKSAPLILADSSAYTAYLNPDLLSQKITFGDEEYELPLLGLWQVDNLSLVLETIEILKQNGIAISQEALKSGLKKVKWPARFQYIKEKNLVIDGAHNVSAAKSLRQSLDLYFPNQRRIWIYSSLDTKDFESIIKILFKNDDIVICTKSSSKNAVPPEIIKEKIKNINNSQEVYTANDVKEIIKILSVLTVNDYLIIVAGSLYTIGEMLTLISI